MSDDVRRVLLATDGSPDAGEALEWLVEFPLEPETVFEVVSVLPRPFPSEAIVADRWDALVGESQRVVDDACRRLAKCWTKVGGRVLEGDPREAIVQAAMEGRADLIVLGARGLGSVTSFLLGSVSLAVARHAPCPVLVCKGGSRPLRAVSVGMDGSAHAAAALDYVRGLPLPADVSVRLIGVVEPLRYPTSAPGIVAGALKAAMVDLENETRGRLQAALTPAAAALRGHVGRVATATPTGAPAATILRDAAIYGSDLIVVGARGLGTLERITLGSVSESVLRHATCPVLVVRPRA